MGSNCLVNPTVAKRDVIMEYHLGSLVPGYEVFEIVFMVRVRYLYQDQFGILMGYWLTCFLWITSVFLVN